MTDNLRTPEHWQHIDAAEAGTTATDHLDTAAAAITAPRIRSHQLLGIEPGATVLDVGFGSGIALREIADLVGRDGTVVGLDPSAAMLEQARLRLEGVPRTSTSSRARPRALDSTATGSTRCAPSAS